MPKLPIGIASLFLTAFLLPAAATADTPPDRSGLSYEENVTINMVCFAASKQGNGAYNNCVRGQLAALAKHPSPDRTSISAARNQRIERDCDYQRRTDIGSYNDCLKKSIEKPATKDETAGSDFLPNISKVFAKGPDRPAQKEVPAELAQPNTVLIARPSQIDNHPLSAADVFKKVERSIFVVYATPSLADARSREVAIGTAVAVSDHLLLTNCHIVQNRPVIRITRAEREEVATLLAGDYTADRCVLQAEGTPLPAIGGVRLFKDLAIGERVFAIGTPRGLDRTLTQGIISGLRNFSGRNFVQTDAPISHGNSGGGLFDESGNLIGITTLTLATQAGFQNLNFAVAASDYWEKK